MSLCTKSRTKIEEDNRCTNTDDGLSCLSYLEQLLDTSLNTSYGENCNANEPATTHENGTDILQEGTFSPFSGSLEDLVNTFDEKITSCFRDYGTNVESLAPVQVRTQEEIMNECQ